VRAVLIHALHIKEIFMRTVLGLALGLAFVAPAFAGTPLSNKSYPSAVGAARAEAARRLDSDKAITGKGGLYGLKLGAKDFSARKAKASGSVLTYKLTANTAIGGGFPDFVTNVKVKQLKNGTFKAYQSPGNDKTIGETFP
jgi:hypothetical protein